MLGRTGLHATRWLFSQDHARVTYSLLDKCSCLFAALLTHFSSSVASWEVVSLYVQPETVLSTCRVIEMIPFHASSDIFLMWGIFPLIGFQLKMVKLNDAEQKQP